MCTSVKGNPNVSNSITIQFDISQYKISINSALFRLINASCEKLKIVLPTIYTILQSHRRRSKIEARVTKNKNIIVMCLIVGQVHHRSHLGLKLNPSHLEQGQQSLDVKSPYADGFPDGGEEQNH
jgi:hypothetical protein